MDEIAKIVNLQVEQLTERLANRRIALEVTDAASEYLAMDGYDPAYGARPLRRLIQREIGDQLARMLLGGQVKDGDTVVADARFMSADDVASAAEFGTFGGERSGLVLSVREG